LYSLLRRADELGCDVVLTTVPSEHGLGAAIADRLRRAAGPRSGELTPPQNP
jgi:L-threonylcarbamoyladenylate synthase